MKTKLSLWCIALAFALVSVAFAQGQMRDGRTFGTVEPDGKIIGTAIDGISSPVEMAAYNEAKKSGKLPITTNDGSFGISDWSIETINSAGFGSLGDGNWSLYYNGEKVHNSGNFALSASVDVPNGALIDGFTSRYSDTDVANDITIALYRNNVDGTDSAIGSYTSSGTPGNEIAIYTTLTAPETVDKWHHHYYFIVTSTSTTIAFKGVTVWYHRTVSPAPATATFGDVPTTHPFFQYVQALAASGITAGCGSGNFCPDAAVTRGQMAVFLAKALGLHYGGYSFGY